MIKNEIKIRTGVLKNYPIKYRLCWIINRIMFRSPWRRAIVTKAWADEIAKGLGGVGSIVLVLKEPLPPEALNDGREPCWVLHPRSHKKHLKACGATKEVRWPLFLDQAIVVP